MTDEDHPRDDQSPERFFFIHIQKTAGTSLRRHLLENFDRSEIYPSPQKGGKYAYLILYKDGAPLVGLPPEDQARYRLFHGHLPYAVTQRLAFGKPPTTFTMLREPVARILSLLDHKKRRLPEFADASLEEIYEHPRFFESQILNHQAKIFAVPDDSELLSGFDPFAVGPTELECARKNLNKVEVIGLQSDMPAFLGELKRKFGWKILQSDVRENVGSSIKVNQSFLDRIAADNEIDLEFYRYAQELVRKRAAEA